MAKMSKEELKKKISESITDNEDLVIELLEDIEDSVDVVDNSENDSLRTELEEAKNKVKEITQKYKERFLSNSDEEIEETEEIEEPEEKEIIDIKEI